MLLDEPLEASRLSAMGTRIVESAAYPIQSG